MDRPTHPEKLWSALAPVKIAILMPSVSPPQLDISSVLKMGHER